MLRFVSKRQEETLISPELLQLPIPKRLLELLVDRGLDTPLAIEEYLHPDKSRLHDPMCMQDMERAVEVIRASIAGGEEIIVFGDYDVDGVTATAILLTYLRKQGAKAGFYIPDRHGEGYGLNKAAIEQIAKHAKLLITVDCGITCPEEVAYARSLGMRVIVTDHHQLGPVLPQCEAVLNPLLGTYPFRKLCGAGVAFKLVQALGGEEAIESLWELAALATIADIVPLMGENRVIVANGLKAMAATKRPGLLALMESSGVEPAHVTASDIAFRMAPRINAGGRLALASRGVELLTTRKLDIAREIAQELDQDNTKRRELEMEIFNQADHLAQTEIDFLQERAIVVCGEGWNPGVIGLAASRLVEKYRWPTILLSRDGDVCVGSARSIPGVNIHDAMATCRDLFVRFGGHAQAAGLTIEHRHIAEFKRRLSIAIAEQSAPEAFIPTEEFDLEMELGEMTEELIQAFSSMQPTGFGNPAPVFCVRGVHTTDIRQIGKDGAHLRMRLSQGNDLRNAIGFRMGDRARNMPEVIEAVLALSINQWQDKRSVQCELRQLQAYMPAKAFLSECQRRTGEIERNLFAALLHSGSETQAETLTLEEAKERLAHEWLGKYQGTMLCVHSVSALKMLNIHLALIHAQLDYAFGKLEDIRMFNTLVMAPDWEGMNCRPSVILMMDGCVSEGERAWIRSRFPQARLIEVQDLARQTRSEAVSLLPDDDALRKLYRVLKQREKMEHTLEILTQETGMKIGQIRCGMHIFSELGLMEWQETPFSYRIKQSGKVSLQDSRLRCRLLDMKKDL